MCLCKDCDYVDITTYGDLAKYERVLFCQCCGGQRFIYREVEANRCPNRLRINASSTVA